MIQFKSIGIKLVSSILLLTLVPIIGLSIYNYGYFKSHSIKTNLGIMDRFTRGFTQKLDTKFFKSLELFEAWISSDIASAALEYDTPEEAIGYLNEITNNNMILKQAFICKTNGEIYAANFEVIDKSKKGTIPDWFELVDKEFLFISKLQYFTVAGEQMRSMLFSSPVYNSTDEIQGYLVGFFNWLEIENLLQAHRDEIVRAGFQTGTVCIADTNENILSFQSYKIINAKNIRFKSLSKKDGFLQFGKQNWYGCKNSTSFGESDFTVLNLIEEKDMVTASQKMLRISMIVLVIFIPTVTLLILALSRGVTRPLVRVVNILKDIAEGEGDLTKRIELDSKDEIGQLGLWFSRFVENIESIIKNVKSAAVHISDSSKEIDQGNENITKQIQEHASSLEETSSITEQMTSTVQNNAQNASQMSQLANDTRNAANTGDELVRNTMDAMKEITNSTKKISEIIGVIDEIAFQTNLLALNAAVEAARAGDQGRGFAVVAVEVRNLAQRSASAAKEIKTLITESVEKVESGSELMDDTGKNFQEIIEDIKKVADFAGSINAAAQEQSQGIEQINKAVTEMDHGNQENANMIVEINSISHQMMDHIGTLQEMVSKFRVSGETTDESDEEESEEELTALSEPNQEVIEETI